MPVGPLHDRVPDDWDAFEASGAYCQGLVKLHHFLATTARISCLVQSFKVTRFKAALSSLALDVESFWQPRKSNVSGLRA